MSTFYTSSYLRIDVLRLVAARLTIDVLRKQQAPTVEVADTLASDQADAPESLIDQEEEKLLSEALEKLSSRELLIIDLHFRRGLPAEEVASILKISVGAVYTQKSRLLDKLRQSLRETSSA